MVRFKLIAIFFSLATVLFAQPYPDARVDSLLHRGIDLILDHEYTQALQLSDELLRYSPETPWAELNSAGVYIMQSFDFGINSDQDKIDSLLETAEDKTSDLLDADPANPWNLFFMGSTKGFEAYFFISQQDYLSAITEAFFAVQYYNQCLKIDSTFYQAYMPIGNYLFWRSVKTEFLHWLPFVEDESGKGLDMLETAMRKPVINNYLAANSLCWAYIFNKNFEKTAEIALEMLELHPKNRVFKLALARAYQEIAPQKAVEIFDEVREEMKLTGVLYDDKNIELLFRSGVVLFKNGNYRRAEKYFREITAGNNIENISSLSEDRIKNAEAYLSELKNKSK